MDIFSGVFKEVDSVLNSAKTMFSRTKSIETATSDDDEITPPYILEEVVELLANPSEVVIVRDAVVRKLRERSPYVKFKALRVVKHCCNRSIEFRRAMQKEASAVRELASFSGPPDPYKGDIPNQRVRAMAKEAIEAVFSTAPATQGLTPGTLTQQGRIQGFGNMGSVTSDRPAVAQGYGSAGAGPGPRGGGAAPLSSGREGSYGAPHRGAANPDGSFSDMLAAELSDAYRVTGLADLVSGIASKVGTVQTGPSYPPGYNPSGTSSSSSASASLTGPSWSSGGPRGYGATSSVSSGGPGSGYQPAAYGSGSRTSGGAPAGYQPVMITGAAPPAPVVLASDLNITSGDEAVLVERLCRGNGGEEDVRSFIRATDRPRGADRLAELVLARVTSADPREATRALAALTAMVSAPESHKARGAFVSTLHEAGLPTLVGLVESAQDPVRAAAATLMSRLGYGAVAPAAAPAPKQADLLDLLSGPAPAAAPAPQAPAAPTGGASLLDSLTIPPPPAAPLGTAGAEDLLSGLTITAPAPAAQPAPQPVAAPRYPGGAPAAPAAAPIPQPQAASPMDPFAASTLTPIAPPAAPAFDLTSMTPAAGAAASTPTNGGGPRGYRPTLGVLGSKPDAFDFVKDSLGKK